MPMDQDSVPPPIMGETDAATDKGASDFKATAPDLHLNPQASPIDAVNVAAAAPKSPDSLPTDPAVMVSLSPVFATSPSPDQKDKRKRSATRSTPSPGVTAKKNVQLRHPHQVQVQKRRRRIRRPPLVLISRQFSQALIWMHWLE